MAGEVPGFKTLCNYAGQVSNSATRAWDNNQVFKSLTLTTAARAVYVADVIVQLAKASFTFLSQVLGGALVAIGTGFYSAKLFYDGLKLLKVDLGNAFTSALGTIVTDPSKRDEVINNLKRSITNIEAHDVISLIVISFYVFIFLAVVFSDDFD